MLFAWCLFRLFRSQSDHIDTMNWRLRTNTWISSRSSRQTQLKIEEHKTSGSPSWSNQNECAIIHGRNLPYNQFGYGAWQCYRWSIDHPSPTQNRGRPEDHIRLDQWYLASLDDHSRLSHHMWKIWSWSNPTAGASADKANLKLGALPSTGDWSISRPRNHHCPWPK